MEAERRRRQELEDQLLAQRLHDSFQKEHMQQAQQNELAAQERQSRLQQEQMHQEQQDELAAQARENRLQQERMQNELAAQVRENRLRQERMQQSHEQQIQENLRTLAITTSAHEELKRREEELERREAERQILENLKEQREKKRLDDEERERQNRQRKFLEASPETLRSLRDLIRLKYKLDVEIWGLRGARKPDRWLVEQKMEKADAVLAEIVEMVQLWEHQSDGAWDEEEWERVQDIRNRLQSGGIRVWADKPIWNEVQDRIGFRGASGAHRRRTRV